MKIVTLFALWKNNIVFANTKKTYFIFIFINIMFV